MTFTKLSKYTAFISFPYILFHIAYLSGGRKINDDAVLFCLVMIVLPPIFALFIHENPFILNVFIAILLTGFSVILLTRIPLVMP